MRRPITAGALGILFLTAPALAQQQAPQAPPSADQATSQLCDMNRVQGEKNAGAIIANNLKTIADLQAKVEKFEAEAKKTAPAEKAPAK